jgi:hypothetical protein
MSQDADGASPLWFSASVVNALNVFFLLAGPSSSRSSYRRGSTGRASMTPTIQVGAATLYSSCPSLTLHMYILSCVNYNHARGGMDTKANGKRATHQPDIKHVIHYIQKKNFKLFRSGWSKSGLTRLFAF